MNIQAILQNFHLWVSLFAVLTGWLCADLVNFLADRLPFINRPREISFHGSRYEKRIKIRYSLVRLTLISSFLWILLFPPIQFNSPVGNIFALLLVGYLVLISVIDIEQRLILHSTSLFGLVFGLALGSWLWGQWEAIYGGILGLGQMIFIYKLGKVYIRLAENRRDQQITGEAIGFGDVILGALMGLILGWQGIFPGLLLALALAGMASLVCLLAACLFNRIQNTSSLPLAPFFAASLLLFLFIK